MARRKKIYKSVTNCSNVSQKVTAGKASNKYTRSAVVKSISSPSVDANISKKNTTNSPEREVLFHPINPLPATTKMWPIVKPEPHFNPTNRSTVQDSEDTSQNLDEAPISEQTTDSNQTLHSDTMQSLSDESVGAFAIYSGINAASSSSGITNDQEDVEDAKSSKNYDCDKITHNEQEDFTPTPQVEIEIEDIFKYDILKHNEQRISMAVRQVEIEITGIDYCNIVKPKEERVSPAPQEKTESSDSKHRVSTPAPQVDTESSNSEYRVSTPAPQVYTESSDSEHRVSTPTPPIELSDTDDSDIVTVPPQIDIESSDNEDCFIVTPNVDSSDIEDCVLVTPTKEEVPRIVDKNRMDWSEQETGRFYQVLAKVGTDLFRMKKMIPDRSRLQLKCKLKHEKKTNRDKVHHSLATKVSKDMLKLKAKQENQLRMNAPPK